MTDSSPLDDEPLQPEEDAILRKGNGDQATARLKAEAARIRDSIGSKRSDKLLRVFDFLLERTLQGRPPSEVEVANEAFSIGRTLDVSQDATVRVYVHRLRKALDGLYAGTSGPRLLVPRGEYSIVLVDEGTPPAGASAEGEVLPVARAQRRWLWPALALALLVLGNVGVWWLVLPHSAHNAPPALARTVLWSQIAHSDRPITVVLGDYYWFAESSGENAARSAAMRLVRDPAINAREDLDVYVMAHPDQARRVVDLDQRYVSSSAVIALGKIFEAVNAIRTDRSRPLNLIPASQLTADILKSSDIVYVGQLSGLGTLLRDPLFQASGFRVGATYDELVDGASGKRYQSDGGMVVSDERVARRDYGYIARLPGPSNNHILILAGTREAALLQMAELANDAAKLQALDAVQGAGSDGFEALYRVRTLGNLNLSG